MRVWYLLHGGRSKSQIQRTFCWRILGKLGKST
ncbi:MAG TPA: DUF3136 domain-containing protein [Caldilineae bacterium]|nr:DUF3136 domain-containing protein [Caldilineae bacterium]